MAMVAQKSLLKAGASVLALAGMLSKLNSKFSEEGTKRAKQGYERAANTKKDNKSIVAKKVNPENTNESNIIHTTSPIANEKPIVSEQPTKQKFILSEEGAYYPIKADNAKTNIPVDEDVKGLIQVKQKNALRMGAGRKSANEYQQALDKAKTFVGGKTDDVWNEIGLDPSITDKDIREAGYTKTDILNDFNLYVNRIDQWSIDTNKKATEKNVEYAVGDLDDYVLAQQNNEFGRAWSAFILDKKHKEEADKQEELKFWDDKEEETYNVWLQEQELTEEEKEAQGIVF